MKKLALAVLLTLATTPAFSSFLVPLVPTNCPHNYLAVICSDGFIYDNACMAAAAGATGCVSYDNSF